VKKLKSNRTTVRTARHCGQRLAKWAMSWTGRSTTVTVNFLCRVSSLVQKKPDFREWLPARFSGPPSFNVYRDNSRALHQTRRWIGCASIVWKAARYKPPLGSSRWCCAFHIHRIGFGSDMAAALSAMSRYGANWTDQQPPARIYRWFAVCSNEFNLANSNRSDSFMALLAWPDHSTTSGLWIP
jgi:hypothetical protein